VYDEVMPINKNNRFLLNLKVKMIQIECYFLNLKGFLVKFLNLNQKNFKEDPNQVDLKSDAILLLFTFALSQGRYANR